MPQAEHTADTIRPPPLAGHPAPFTSKAIRPTPSLRAAADHSGHGSGYSNAAIPAGSRHAAAIGHPSKRSGHATGLAARLASAEVVDDRRPGQR